MTRMTDNERANRYSGFMKNAEASDMDTLIALKKAFTKAAASGKPLSGDVDLDSRSGHYLNQLIAERQAASEDSPDLEATLKRRVVERAAKLTGQSVAAMTKHMVGDREGKRFERYFNALVTKEEQYKRKVHDVIVDTTGQEPLEKEPVAAQE